MPTNEKQQQVAEIKERLTGSSGLIMADYRGLTVKEMRQLRTSVRDMGAVITVYKNSLAQIAIRELDMPNMDEYLEGPTAFVFTPEDPVATAKGLLAFAKEHKVFSFKGGYIDGQLVDAEAVKAIASLPSREELIAKLMGTMLNPLRNFMAMANAPAGAFARAVQAVADQKAAA
ncbi:MAG TPA: 50S ribosomal protein L10 [Coriobacteriia bacterium]|uniref:50S ribosomal protein L10 n=1 Tax=Anaerosoma tenue TaxID=2933588 RepID=UPI00076C3555|nr:50S ribosomal protein L10 [Anaerosoma tenue]KUK47877.1 MAG: 50S ribosomal protein L10 [Actinobacteria bacterium 66_15]MCK8115656.1 50S ribosomal protein L10 [Anaerosoma tenue]HAL31253.1 50S ribosomal protein L10 [Coriobacteriia bacterium]